LLSKPHISLSICIVCYNTQPHQLLTLIDSLSVAVQHLEEKYTLSTIPIYVVDNSPSDKNLCHVTDEKEDYINRQHVELHYISGHGNIGYGSAHNLILERLNSDFHLILNPDLIVDKESLVNAITAIGNDTNAVAISPYAENMSGDKQYLCKRYPSVITFFIRGFLFKPLKRYFSKRLSSYEMRELSEEKDSNGIELVSGCFMLLDTRVFKLVGGFCESYFLYFEDFDLSIRIRKHGEIVYSPKVRIKHAGGEASKKGFSHIFMFVRSGLRFFCTHGWRIL